LCSYFGKGYNIWRKKELKKEIKNGDRREERVDALVIFSPF
jgi:hypothetical protein